MGHTPFHQLRVATQWLPGMEPKGFSGVRVGSAKGVFPDSRLFHHIPAPQRSRGQLEVVHLPSSEVTWPVFDMLKLTAVRDEITRIGRNLKAIETLKELSQSTRRPTLSQRHELLSYCGWGGFGRLFEPHYAGGFAAAQEKLRQILTDSEYQALRSGVTSSIFISPPVARGMWQLAKALGFHGGAVLEPAANTGLLLAAAPRMIARDCVFTAVEQDPMTRALLAMAFQGLPVDVRQGPVDGVPLYEESFDLVIGQLRSRHLEGSAAAAKTMEAKAGHFRELEVAVRSTRPGGLIIMCLPVEFLDSPRSRARKWIAERAELVGAIRLPVNAFKRQSNVAFSSDLLVFRKRDEPASAEEVAWIELGQAADYLMSPAALKWCYSKAQRKQVELARPINKWFELHPDMVIGELDAVESFRGKRLIPEFNGGAEDFRIRLAECIQTIVEANT